MLLGAFRGGNPLERIVGKPSTESGRHAVSHKNGLGVSRQLDVSGLHERPGEAFPNPVYGQSRQAGDSLIILCGTDRV
jgi:hypothetical protein